MSFKESEINADSSLGENVSGIEMDRKRVPLPMIDPSSEGLEQILKAIKNYPHLVHLFGEDLEEESKT